MWEAVAQSARSGLHNPPNIHTHRVCLLHKCTKTYFKNEKKKIVLSLFSRQNPSRAYYCSGYLHVYREDEWTVGAQMAIYIWRRQAIASKTKTSFSERNTKRQVFECHKSRSGSFIPDSSWLCLCVVRETLKLKGATHFIPSRTRIFMSPFTWSEHAPFILFYPLVSQMTLFFP